MVIKVDFDTKDINKLELSLSELAQRANDLTVPFRLIAFDFYRSNPGLIFSLRPGRYEDLKESTKKAKRSKYGSEYPVLVASGRLKNALSIQGSSDNVTIIRPRYLEMGSDLEYLTHLQRGTRTMAARPPILINIDRRIFRWVHTINNYIMKNLRSVAA